MNEGLLSVKNASGRQVSLLNSDSKRKYHCTEPGCNKSFTTSGHLARHNRIHTGEKNFPCLFPGCQSRFSRQDNMMQHYKTHMSPKSKRSQKRGLVEDIRPKPRLHAHHRIRSDPVRVEPPLTIDQHLSNYHESLKTTTTTDTLYDFPVPLSSVAKRPSMTIVHPPQKQQQDSLFYQHRPLRYNKPSGNDLPYTLLHPTQRQEKLPEKVVQNQMSGNNSDDPMDEDASSSDSLLQLAHIVSTFG